MVDTRRRKLRKPCSKELQQFAESVGLGVVVMCPEGTKLIVEPNTMQVLKTALVMRVALDVIEEITPLGLGQQIEAFAWFRLPQLK